MKKTFSVLMACFLAVSCSGGIIEQAQDVVTNFNTLIASGDGEQAAKLWVPSANPKELDAVLDSFAKKLAPDPKTARFEAMGSKVYKTWVFSGVIYKDAVEVDIKVAIPPKAPQQGDLVTPQPVVYRQLSYVVEIDGKPLIVESQMRMVK